MLDIPRQYIFDDQNRPLAVQIPIAIYNQIEDILENFGLVKLMHEVEDDELLSGDDASSYYQSLNLQNAES